MSRFGHRLFSGRHRFASAIWVPWFWMLGSVWVGVHAEELPPPRPPSANAEQPLYLELVINQKPSGKVVRVLRSGDEFRVAAGDLSAFGLPVFGADSELVALNSLTWMKVHYDENHLRLWLEVPADWLPVQYVGSYRRNAQEPAQTGTGAIFNYDVFVNHPATGPAITSAGNELRLFGRWGTLSNHGVYQYGAGEGRYMRYDTRWEYSDPERMLTYEAGDLVTRGLSWNSAVRIGGAAISRNFSIRPDVVTYPLPVFSGQAALPTTLDVFVEGQKIDRQSIGPGPFTLTNLPYINGAGEAVVVTTDALGRQVSTTLPFYVSSSLLSRGFLDYSIAAGSLRRDYGQQNFAYGSAVASGSLRYGVRDGFTLETHAEAANELQLLGLGGGFALGHYGVLNAAYAHSRMRERSGGQSSVGYQYANRRYSFAVQQLRRDRGFADLSVYQRGEPGLMRSSLQATGAVNLRDGSNLGLGYFNIESADGSHNRQANLSWSRSVGAHSYLYFSASRNIGTSGWSGELQWLWSLDGRDTLHAGYERNRNGSDRLRFDYSRSVPVLGGLGWQLGYANEPDSSHYAQASVDWRNPYLQLRLGTYGDENARTAWGNLAGSLIWMDGDAFASNRINDAFVLISTDGQAGIPVRYENQLVGTTDRRGHLLVPWVTPWYAAKYQIDTLDLPLYMDTPLVEQRVAVRGGSGYVVRFPAHPTVTAVVTVHDLQGQPLPVGTTATTSDGKRHSIGWDGVLYLEAPAAHNEIDVDAPGGPCRVSFQIDLKTPQVAQIGPLLCQPEAP